MNEIFDALRLHRQLGAQPLRQFANIFFSLGITLFLACLIDSVSRSGDLRKLTVVNSCVVADTVDSKRDAESIRNTAAVGLLNDGAPLRLVRLDELVFALNDCEMPDAECDQQERAEKDLQQPIRFLQRGQHVFY